MIRGRILGIETSCDETGAAVLESDKSGIKILSNSLASSVTIHSETGGIIPENAAREQVKFIIPVIKEALEKAGVEKPSEELDAISVTVGPGLIGSLLVGVETAKTLSLVWKLPIIPVNHLYGHLYANFVGENPMLPALALLVSGGHTDLVVMEEHDKLRWIGGTRDDAAGEALDKIGRLINLPYPAGPTIESLAKKGNAERFNFPSPLINSSDYDFSFSGLKTAVVREVKSLDELDSETVGNICASVQKAIIDVLVKKTLRAAKEFSVKSVLLGGGVSANSALREALKSSLKKHSPEVKLNFPEKFLCTDNGAMIAAAAFFKEKSSWKQLEASPSLHF